jgi:hypothetical protein
MTHLSNDICIDYYCRDLVGREEKAKLSPLRFLLGMFAQRVPYAKEESRLSTRNGPCPVFISQKVGHCRRMNNSMLHPTSQI